MSERKNYQETNINSLVPFANHPFKQYEGQRFDDMVESICENGVLAPIIIRNIADGKYEILSGHNRVAAAREAGLDSVPAIVRKNLSDDEAMFIVTETNLIQRSFADMKHSERAVVIAVHYDSMKKKSGYRSDLLEDVDSTLSLIATRSTRSKIGEQYGLSKDTINRYLRIHKLIPPLKELLDEGKFGVYVAVALSYLREIEQEIVNNLVSNSNKKINIKIANELHKESKRNEMGEKTIRRVIDEESSSAKIKPLNFGSRFLSQYFDKEQTPEAMKSTIEEALKLYFANKED